MSAPLIPEQRQQEVLRLLRGAGVLGIRNLADALGVSHMTVRRDIAALENEGQVVSVAGGARLADRAGTEPPVERVSRAGMELPRKRAIAEAAVALVSDGAAVFLDAGTTCEALVPGIARRRDITVVTNDFVSVSRLGEHPTIESFHTGGVIDFSSGSATGPLAAAMLGSMHLDVAFISTGTWDLPHGVTARSLDQVALKRAAMAAAGSCVLLADSTKLGTAERFRVAPLDAFDAIVTDEGVSHDVADAVGELGVTVHRAPL